MSHSLGLLLAQDGAQALHVARNDGECDVSLEAVDPMVRADVQAVLLQGIDGRLHCAVLLAQPHKLGLLLAGSIHRIEPTLSGQHHRIRKFIESGLIGALG